MTRRKLIEVALPLDAINEASAREKSIRHGHPSTLHLWWSRKPLATVRAVIFASLVDDPDDPDAPPAFVSACRNLAANLLPPGAPDTPRQRLFGFIAQLVRWESTTDQVVLEQARELIRLCTDGNPPPLLDPFAGGGSIPLEAQRLGLEAHASDLNPVPVIINKALIEIPPRFAGKPPINPEDQKRGDAGWRGAAGLAADVRYYGAWMRERAWERIGHLYPKKDGETVIAWLWARTVKSPNPNVKAPVPLVGSWELSKKKGRHAWIEPIFTAESERIQYTVKTAQAASVAPGTVNRKGGKCLISGMAMPFEYIRAEGKAGRMGAQMIAIVTEGKGRRSYHAPSADHEAIAAQAVPTWKPDAHLEGKAAVSLPLYGMPTYGDLFTPRQLVALTTFSDLVAEARAQIQQDARRAALHGGGHS